MNYYEYKLKYSNLIQSPKKEICQVIDFCKSKGFLREIDVLSIPIGMLACFIYSVINTIDCSMRCIPVFDELIHDIKNNVYSVLNNYKITLKCFVYDNTVNDRFYEHYYAETDDREVYFLIDETSGLLYSNSTELLLEAKIYQGIDQKFIDDYESIEFREYLKSIYILEEYREI